MSVTPRVEALITAAHAAAPDVEPPVSEPVKALTTAFMHDLGMSAALAATVADRFAAAVALRGKGVTERSIARELGVSAATLSRDLAFVAEVASGSSRLRERLLGERPAIAA